MSDALISSLLAAVEANPQDIPLRLHVSEMLIAAGRPSEAIPHLGAVLATTQGNEQAQKLMAIALIPPATPPQGTPTDARRAPPTTSGSPEFDWSLAEGQVADLAPPMFADSTPARSDVVDVEQSGIRLAGVGGLEEVKKRIEAIFLAPLRNPELRQMYGMLLRGGLLMYGPPAAARPSSRAPSRGNSMRASSMSRSLTFWTCSSARASATFMNSSR